MSATEQSGPSIAGRPKPVWLIGTSVLGQWALPGLGYAILGRRGRAAVAGGGILFMALWGLYLGGELSVPRPHDLISYLKTFACVGLGAFYAYGTHSEGMLNGVGDITRASYDYGCAFVWAAGLLGYLLMLDVFDIAMGRKD